MNLMRAFRASFLDFIANPITQGESTYRYLEDGLLIVDAEGKVNAFGDYNQIKDQLTPDIEVIDYQNKLIMPGFIDSHVHYPQTDIIASHGAQLLDWLEQYTFPIEKKFSDYDYAKETAQFFLKQLISNGTTTALTFATVHPQSVDAIFEVSQSINYSMIAGKVMMDQNAPDDLKDTPEQAYEQSQQLIERWHQKGRLKYAVTPRFAITSSEAQLEVAKTLRKENPTTYLQSHLAENVDEIAWVAKLFPWSKSYLDVYDHFDLLGERAVYAHCVHLETNEFKQMTQTGTAISYCPTSNLFLGSGLFDLLKSVETDTLLTLGSDVGGGTSFSQFQVMQEAYKIGQLTGYNLSPFYAFYLLTLGAAQALHLSNEIGNFDTGKIADFNVIDFSATELMHRRQQTVNNLEERLFALMMLGDDRHIAATYIAGQHINLSDLDTVA